MKAKLTTMIAALALPVLASAWTPAGDNIRTAWAEQVSPKNVHSEYPRPQMVRSDWKSLNGLWDYAITEAGAAAMTESEGEILVPFAVESSLSGVGRTVGEDKALWYRRTFSVPGKWRHRKVLLHFDAVDWGCEVWVNGEKAGSHTGGYTAFDFDITGLLRDGDQELTVKVLDGTDNGKQPRGKQVSNPRSIWYTAVTGIWQTVWLEAVPEKGYITDYKTVSDIDSGRLTVHAACSGALEGDIVRVELMEGRKKVASATAAFNSDAVLDVPGMHLWTPDDPFIYDMKISLVRKGRTIDAVGAYTTMRKISAIEDSKGYKRLALNNRILFQFGPLDQGWWPDGLYTAPTDEALKYDIIKTKDFGFNMIRKHIKVEPARWYYWCDRLGMMVWQDMPSVEDNKRNVWSQKFNAYDSGTDTPMSDEVKANFRKEWKEIVNQLDKFQCIVMWVPFNEAWGQFDTPEIVGFTRSLDGTRLINMASGGNWISGGVGDILDSHHYPEPRMRVIDKDLVNVLGEYGGIGLPVEGHLWQKDKNWGYVQHKNSEEVTATFLKYDEALKAIALKNCAAAVYTQTTDVEGEVNGLMTYDRKVIKVDESGLYKANRDIIEAASGNAL